MRDNHLLGGLVVNRKTPGAFDPQVIELLKTFATQSALAIQNARLFREIEIKSRQLETASRHKSEFLANMSHELRTPLNAIIGFSEVLSERLFGEMNEKQAEYVGDISESGRHLLNLINDILDLSKIEAGRMELDPSDFDIATTIDNTLSWSASARNGAASRCAARWTDELGHDPCRRAQGEAGAAESAVERAEVHARGRRDRRPRHRARRRTEIAVTDTGVGIAPEDQEAVFEEFRQVGSAAKKIEGTGLGLAISRKFIELHGGRIWVESQLGAGSTFTFTLPLRRTVAPDVLEFPVPLGTSEPPVPGLLPDVDPDGLLEYSVVFTDRALNHMSQSFQGVMRDISAHAEARLPRALGRRGAGRRNVRHGGRRPPVRDRQEVPRDPQRLVQLSLDADLRHGAIPPQAPC